MSQNANATVIKSLSATSYNGRFENTVSPYTIAGQFGTNGEKVLTNISGSVSASNAPVASFNAYKNGETFRYNFSEVSDITILAAIASAVSTTVAAVETELAAVNA